MAKSDPEEKAEKTMNELKEFAKVAHSLVEVTHLIEVPFSGHVMADAIFYLNQKMAEEGRSPTDREDVADGTLPFRNYPATKNPNFNMDMRSYDRQYGPHIPSYMLTGSGQAKQIRDCFPPYEQVLEKIESDLATVNSWLETHPKYGPRMRKAIEAAISNFNVVKNLKTACQLPGKITDPFDTLHEIALVKIGDAVSALKSLTKMFKAKANRLIDSLPESDWNTAQNIWTNETSIAFRHNPKVPYHLATTFGKEITDSSLPISQESELPSSELSSKESLSKEPLTPEEDFAEAAKAFKALGELRFLLVSPLAAHSGLDLLVSDPSLKELFFEKDAPKNAARLLRKALPGVEYLQLLARDRVNIVLRWLERHPTWPMEENKKTTCLETMRTVKDAVIKSEVQRKWADDIENGLIVKWRSRLKDTAFLNIDDSARAIDGVCLSLAAPIQRIVKKLPRISREEVMMELMDMYFPKVRTNEKIPEFVKERWRSELILD